MSDGFFYTVATLIGIALFAGLVAVLLAVSSYQCQARWPGKNPTWGFAQGCMIDTEAGRIPAANYRVL